MIDEGVFLIYLVFGSELVELRCFECWSIIKENSVQDSEHVNDVALKEANNVLRPYYFEHNGFDPLGKIVSHGKDEPMPIRGWRFNWSDHISTQCRKWLGGYHRMQGLRGLVNEVTMKLTLMTLLCSVHAVLNEGGPVIAQ